MRGKIKCRVDIEERSECILCCDHCKDRCEKECIFAKRKRRGKERGNGIAVKCNHKTSITDTVNDNYCAKCNDLKESILSGHTEENDLYKCKKCGTVNIEGLGELKKKSPGYLSLKKAVISNCEENKDCKFNPNGCDKEGRTGCFHKYCDKFKWVIERAKHYGESLDMNWEDILDSWEGRRSYWYMNYYQDANQPLIKADKVRVFDTVEDLHKSIGDKGFRCPSCGQVTTNPYECNSGYKVTKDKVCDWKVYGLFGSLGKGINVFVKSEMRSNDIFMPIAWEEGEDE